MAAPGVPTGAPSPGLHRSPDSSPAHPPQTRLPRKATSPWSELQNTQRVSTFTRAIAPSRTEISSSSPGSMPKSRLSSTGTTIRPRWSMRRATPLVTSISRWHLRSPSVLYGRGPALRHYADLLRQRRPPHRPRLHDRDRRRHLPLAPPPGRRRRLPDRDGRARAQGGPDGGGQRSDPPGVGRPDGGALQGGLAPAPDRQRRLHPHERAPPPPGRPALPADRLRHRGHRAGDLRGALLRLVRGLLRRERAVRRLLPHPRLTRAAHEGGDLLFKAQP